MLKMAGEAKRNRRAKKREKTKAQRKKLKKALKTYGGQNGGN